jgi:predicted DNA-binding transcriptional regulator AlpA
MTNNNELITENKNVSIESILLESVESLMEKKFVHYFEELKKALTYQTANQTANDDLMSREQVLEMLQINASTLWHWQNKGKIPVYKFSNKCYYKRSEIMNCLTPLKR